MQSGGEPAPGRSQSGAHTLKHPTISPPGWAKTKERQTVLLKK